MYYSERKQTPHKCCSSGIQDSEDRDNDENCTLAWTCFQLQAHLCFAVIEGITCASQTFELHCRGKQVIKDIASGLVTLHDQSICHLDLKSPNVLLTSERRGKIADFGLGKMLNGVPASTLSQIGTPPWTCPELLLRGRYSVKSDIWSLSTILIEVSVPTACPPDS